MPTLAHHIRRSLAVLLSAGTIILLAACTGAPSPTVEPTTVAATPAPTEVLPTRRPTRPGPTPITNVTIEVTGRTVHTTIKPNSVARVSLTDAPLEVLIHYPGSLEGKDVNSDIVQPSSVTWSITIMPQPDPNTFAIGLLGYEPGFFTVRTTASQYADVRFSIQAVAPTPEPGATPPAGSATGQPGAGAPAVATPVPASGLVMPATPVVLSRMPAVRILYRFQAPYERRAGSQTALTANGDPVCHKAQPPCPLPSRQF